MAGYGLIRVGEHWNKSLRHLGAEVYLDLVSRVGEVKINKVYVSSLFAAESSHQYLFAPLLADHLGLEHVPATRVEAGDASGGIAVHEAFLSIKSGMFDSVLVIGAEKMTEHVASISTESRAKLLDSKYESPHGLTLAGTYALMMREYMDKYSVPREAFGMFSVEMHKNAVNNPYAQLRFPITLEKYFESPTTADPLKLYDCAPISDGAAALLLTSLDYGKEISDSLVEIKASSAATDNFSIIDRDSILELKSTSKALEEALSEAKVKRRNIDVLEIHDSFTIAAFLSLESLGFSQKGKTHELVLNNYFSKDSDLPVNPGGGLKARGHPMGATGVYQLVESYMQLTGEAGHFQVPDPKNILVQNMGGTGSITVVHILSRIE